MAVCSACKREYGRQMYASNICEDCIGKYDRERGHTERREEFDNACREYGAECASTMKLVYLDNSDGQQLAEALHAKGRALGRVRTAWLAMVAAGDPETKQ